MTYADAARRGARRAVAFMTGFTVTLPIVQHIFEGRLLIIP